MLSTIKMKKIVFLSILLSLSLVISLFESIIPLPLPIPGVKLGLSNIVILVTMICFGFKESLLISILKSLLQSLLIGQLSSFAYSLIGSLFSLATMYIAFKFFKKYLSLVGVSEIGAFFFNIGQILVASIILNNLRIFVYLPILTFTGIFTGYFVGISSKYISNKLMKVIFK